MAAHIAKSSRISELTKAERIRCDSTNDYENCLLPQVPDLSMKVPVIKGDFNKLPKKVQAFIEENVTVCQPKGVYICDGSEEESVKIKEKMTERGMFIKLQNCENCYLVRTDPKDVARVEGKTFIVTDDKYDTVPHVKEGVDGTLGKWMSPLEMTKQFKERFPGCMKGRVMYVIPFCMGPLGSPLSKIGVQLTDFNYVVLSMQVMTRVSSRVWELLGDDDFVQCVHSIGCPRPVERKIISHWPCNPEKVLIAHFPDEWKIMSYGSGYGGNSLLGKKCFALRIASKIARDEGWLAEHMLIMSVTNPEGKERFIAAAFPSACGKTNMAMLKPSLPGWKVRCIGDDIAWLKFDEEGQLRAINPEAGFFGVAPGTNEKTNPVAMETLQKNSIFTNVALTEQGNVFWEGLEKNITPETSVTSWKGELWKLGDKEKAAHPNCRFCTPISQCPIIHDQWEDPRGVPIDAIVFGGRRPHGVPLVYETFGWEHGVMVGSVMKSEATAVAEHQGKGIMHDPMAMRPFLGYNFGKYLDHWLSLEKPGRKMPKIFHVNWFRLDQDKKFLWPGFGENIRVIDWMFKRMDGEDVAESSPIGNIPKKGTINVDGLSNIDWDHLFSIPKQYWQENIQEEIDFLDEQVGEDLPERVRHQLNAQKARIEEMQ